MNEFERMVSDRLNRGSPEKREKMQRCSNLVFKFNHTESWVQQEAILKLLIEKQGTGLIVRPPFMCDFGENITIGDNSYINSGCTILDDSLVKIGSNVFIGPSVGIYTAEHPIVSEFRNERYYISHGIEIGDDVWIGGHTVVLGGVHIGKGAVIGAGSVVTHDIPSNVIAFGNPCRVYREINDDDYAYWRGLVQDYLNEQMEREVNL